MDLSAFRIHGPKALMAVLAITVAAGHATAALTATPNSATLTCNTATGPGNPATIVVKPAAPLAGASTVVVTVGALTGGVVVTPPNVTTLSTANQAAGLIYSVTLAPGCVGVTTAAPTFHFFAGGVSDVLVTVNTTLVATTSGLSAAPVTVTCARSGGGVYTPGPAGTVSVTSAAVGGTAFTVDNTTNPPPAWLTVTPLTGGTASSTAVTFSVVAAAGCGGFAAGTSNVATLHLLNAPGPDKLVNVTLQVLPPSPLTASPSPATLTYTKGSGTAGKVDVAVSSVVTPAPFFAVDTSSLPSWLTIDATTGVVPKSIRFSSTSVADTLPPGSYSANVRLKVSGYADLAVPISFSVNNSAPKLSVSEGTTRNISWVLGTPLPAPVITAVSTDSPISYSVKTGGTLAPTVAANMASGLAYSFGTQIPVTFSPLVFGAAQPGNVLTGTVTLTWGTPASTIVVTFNVTVQSPGATVTGIAPASVPTAAAGQVFTVTLSGAGFVPSTDPAQKTKVGIVVSNSIVADTNIAVNVVNSSNIVLTITVPATADAYLPFSTSGNGGAVSLGVCNPVGGACTIPSGTATLNIGTNPIIQAVTSSAAFLQVTPPALQTVAPYDIISVFGANFCSSGGTGCSSSQILYGAPDPVSLRYGTTLSPDSAGSTARALSVTFQTHGGSPTLIGTAPLLFATNGQINLLVPAAVSAQVGSTVDMVVNFGYGSGATMKSSAPFPVSVVATNPGVFTVGANGQGDGAILDSNWSLVGTGNLAGMRSTATDSDVVQLYVTGLGVPDSSGSNASSGTVSGAVWGTDCVSIASFLTSLNASASTSLTNLDGNVVQSSLLNTNRLIPCITSSASNVPSVTVGGVAATVLYAGWVPDTIAGLYQINLTLPGSAAGPFTSMAGTSISSITTPVQLPVVVTANSRTSQAGVGVWVAPRLKVAPPTGAGLAGTVGVAWSSSNNSAVATEGTSPYRYAVTSGLLPSGLTLNVGTGAITGTPNANTAGSYTVTVTATDSANVPVTGTTTFTVTVAGGLVLTSTGSAPYNATFGSASASLTTVSATGGTYPYTYTITAPASLPTGMTINPATGVLGTSALTPAGTYHVTVHAVDSTTGSPLAGNITFDVVVALQMARTSPVDATHGAASTISTISALGNTGTVSYTLANGAPSWVTVNSSTGVLSVTSSCVAGTVTVSVIGTDGTAPANAASAGAGIIPVLITVN